MNYRIEEKPEMILTSYKKHFTGAPYGKEREEQEEQLFETKDIKDPICDYFELLNHRIQILTEWMPDMGFQLKNAPELACRLLLMQAVFLSMRNIRWYSKILKKRPTQIKIILRF